VGVIAEMAIWQRQQGNVQGLTHRPKTA
jgi:hypothetical protein